MNREPQLPAEYSAAALMDPRWQTVLARAAKLATGDRRQPIGPLLIEESDVIHLGTTPGEQYGWECARCQQVSGLAYGDDNTARRGLSVHTLFDCAAPR